MRILYEIDRRDILVAAKADEEVGWIEIEAAFIERCVAFTGGTYGPITFP